MTTPESLYLSNETNVYDSSTYRLRAVVDPTVRAVRLYPLTEAGLVDGGLVGRYALGGDSCEDLEDEASALDVEVNRATVAARALRDRIRNAEDLRARASAGLDDLAAKLYRAQMAAGPASSWTTWDSLPESTRDSWRLLARTAKEALADA